MSVAKERAIVSIDGANLYRGLKQCYAIERLDLDPFCKDITRKIAVKYKWEVK